MIDEITNQSPIFQNLNLYTTDKALSDAVRREGGSSGARRLSSFGQTCGSAEALERGRLANENPPKLKPFDRQGRRIDEVEFHPAYHDLMKMSFAERLHCRPWSHLSAPADKVEMNAHVIRAAGFYLASQAEAGHCCPVTMTNASVPLLLQDETLRRDWLPKVLSKTYDDRFLPVGDKRSASIGMAMTEKQGGTDVRANTTRAVRAGVRQRDGYLISGHKWFMSAPMSDAFFVLAQTGVGLSCLFVPRFKPDGTRNGLCLLRLKDKLGNRSNASSEVEFDNAYGLCVGEEGQGVRTIIEMVTHTRLDCALGSAGLMRLAVAHALNHAEHRSVFQKLLIDQPMMRQVLADLVLEVEAATALAMRLARSFDRCREEGEAAWRRVMTPITKYWVCKIAPMVIGEAMECMGGNGYIEEAPLARLYREAPVNAIWEGSGNVMALDILRILQREPDTFAHVMEDIAKDAGDDPHLEAGYAFVQNILQEPRLLDSRGRMLIEGIARLAAGTILRAHAPSPIADAFLASRLGGVARQTYGQGLEQADVSAILKRASPNQ